MVNNNLGTQKINSVEEKFKMSLIIKTLFNMIGGTSESAEQSEIDEEVKKIEKSEDKEYITKLQETLLSYKVKNGRELKEQVKQLKVKKGPKLKESEFKLQQSESKGRER